MIYGVLAQTLQPPLDTLHYIKQSDVPSAFHLLAPSLAHPLIRDPLHRLSERAKVAPISRAHVSPSGRQSMDSPDCEVCVLRHPYSNIVTSKSFGVAIRARKTASDGMHHNLICP